MKSDRKQTILFIIILLILSMGIGYAFLTTTLTIDGVSDIDSSSWDIHFENLEVAPESNCDIISSPTIGNNGTSVSYSIKLTEPGSQFGFTVDAVNEGTLDAIIDNITVKINGVEEELPPYLIIYSFHNNIVMSPISKGEVLVSGDTEKYLFALVYDPYVTIDNLPQEDTTLNVSIDIDYIQLQSSLTDNIYVYTIGDTPRTIGNEFNNNSIYYNYKDAFNSFNNLTILRHYILNNKISSTEIYFKKNGYIYHLKGGDGGEAYSNNRLMMLNAFSLDDDYYCYQHDFSYECSIDDLFVFTDYYGRVYVKNNDNIGCEIDATGKSWCGELSN